MKSSYLPYKKHTLRAATIRRPLKMITGDVAMPRLYRTHAAVPQLTKSQLQDDNASSSY